MIFFAYFMPPFIIVALLTLYIMSNMHPKLKDILHRIGFVLWALVSLSLLTVAGYMFYISVPEMAVNVASCFSKNQFTAIVKEHHSHTGRGTSTNTLIVEFTENGQTVEKKILYDSMNPMNSISGIDKKNKAGEETQVCRIGKSYIIKNSIFNNILNDIFIIICALFLTVGMVINLKASISGIIKGYVEL